MFERLLPPETPRSNPNPEIMQQIAAVLRKRFDRILLVTASEEVKQHRFAQRLLQVNPVLAPQEAADDASRRLALQIPDSIKQPFCDAAIPNDADLASLTKSVQATWNSLQQQS